ncbi:dihydrolipoamide dehydrogenase [Natronobacillus azotifigens]|uniref:Dihydrolipoyl dehydrogenase n=1 Tax=Natronobacillus azotifigens TaxID=472978 RepID=A0A9J6R950_9BACI|nr:dihydrolipoyl dehydrogenase [Natronobacillus azotifigens]MCZ0701788.1 dihydrolipoyl dehydrogenase [Natronobacillus azotifigens]
MAKNYDLVILGGGTGGYVAAIRAAQLGKSVAIVEKEKLGGVCLHKGCIPTKALLRSAEVYQQTKDSEFFGVKVENVELNFSKVQKRKEQVVEELYQGVLHLIKKNKIDFYHGHGRMLGPSIFSPSSGTISFQPADGSENEMLVAKNVIIATGSTAKTLAEFPVDGEKIITSDDALLFEKLPNSLLIVGGGVIGVEWASMLADFGVKITIVEAAKQLIPTIDRDIAKELHRNLKKKGIKIYTNAKISKSIDQEKGLSLQIEREDNWETVEVEKMLLAIGRTANTTDIGIQNTDIELDQSGFIKVNQDRQTKESHIYAIGDVIGGKQLAHVASYEGKYAVEHMEGQNPLKMNETEIPSCIYSNPEVATIGISEQEAHESGYQIKIGIMHFKANGKAKVLGESDGFIKIITNEKNNDILGVHMIGPKVTELIAEATTAKVLDATSWEIGSTIHPHPSLAEAMAEAALDIDNMKIHG